MQQPRFVSRWMPVVSLTLALLACYGTLGFMAILAAFGVVIAINGAIWTGAIVGSAGLTTLGIALGSRRHRRFGPLLLAVPGFAAIVWVMFGSYSRTIEIAGFAVLAAATAGDWRARHNRASFDGAPEPCGPR